MCRHNANSKHQRKITYADPDRDLDFERDFERLERERERDFESDLRRLPPRLRERERLKNERVKKLMAREHHVFCTKMPIYHCTVKVPASCSHVW